jgi:hypothetical protein
MTTDTKQRDDESPDRRYPLMAAELGRVEPAPRRLRAFLDGHQVFDTTHALGPLIAAEIDQSTGVLTPSQAGALALGGFVP